MESTTTNANISQGSSPTTDASKQVLTQEGQTTQVQQSVDGAANGTSNGNTDKKVNRSKGKGNSKGNSNSKGNGKHTKGEWYDQGRPTELTLALHFPGAKDAQQLAKEAKKAQQLAKEASDAGVDDKEKMFSQVTNYVKDQTGVEILRTSISEFDKQLRKQQRNDGLTVSVLLATLLNLLTNVTSVLGLRSPTATDETATDETAADETATAVEDDADFARAALTARIRRTLDKAKALTASVSNTGVSFENPDSGPGLFYSLCALFFVSGGQKTSDVIRKSGQTIYPDRLSRPPKYPYKASVDDVMKNCGLRPLFAVPLTRKILCELLDGWVFDYFGEQLTEDQLQTLINSLLGDYNPPLADENAAKFYLPMKLSGDKTIVISAWTPMQLRDAKLFLKTNMITTKLQGMVIPREITYFTLDVIGQVAQLLGFELSSVKNVSNGLNPKEKNPHCELFFSIVAALQMLMNTRNHDLGGAVARSLGETLTEIALKTGCTVFDTTESVFTYAVTLTLMSALDDLPFKKDDLTKLTQFMASHADLVKDLQDLKNSPKDQGQKDDQELKKGLVDNLNKTVCAVVNEILRVLHTPMRRQKNPVVSAGDLILEAYLGNDLLNGALQMTHQAHFEETRKNTQLVTGGRGGRGGNDHHVHHTSSGASAAPQLSDTNSFPALPGTGTVPRVTVAAPAKPQGKPHGKSQKIQAAESQKSS